MKCRDLEVDEEWPGLPGRHRDQLDLFCRVEDGHALLNPGDLPPPLRGSTRADEPFAGLYLRVRGAVVCMLTAAHAHGLLPGFTPTLWLGVPLRVHVPKRAPSDLHVLRWSNRQAFEVGISSQAFRNVSVLCTGPERTIIDLVRYARHVGGTTAAAKSLRVYAAAGGSEATLRSVAGALRIPRPAQMILDALLGGTEFQL